MLGCGLNVLNALPTTSLSQLMLPESPPLTLEAVTATIMAVFEQMWNTFLANKGIFEPFMDQYLSLWLHT